MGNSLLAILSRYKRTFDIPKLLSEDPFDKLPYKNWFLSLEAKKKGNKVGRLKFKSQYTSIDLNQYNNTHKIVSKNKIKIAGIKQHLRVFGLEQIKSDYEIANAKLVKKANGYYIKLTCFEFIKESDFTNEVKPDVGLDFGIKDSIITSDGKKFKVSIEESERLKKLQRKFAKATKGSNNWYKLKLQVQKEYEHIANKRNDAGNKIVNFLWFTILLSIFLMFNRQLCLFF
jgi:putative transposase